MAGGRRPAGAGGARRGGGAAGGGGGGNAGGRGGGRPRPPAGGSGGGAPRGGRPAAAGRGKGRGQAPGPDRRKVETGLGGGQVEGRQAVRELLVAGRRRVREVIVSTDRDDAPVLDDIMTLALQMQVPVREVGRAKLGTLARTESHQGIIATANDLRDDAYEDLLRAKGGVAPFLVAVDGVTDPGNLGALLRTAECAGVTGIVLPRHRSVHVTPAVTKSAAGAIEHLRFALVGGLPAAIATATDAGVLVVGLDMDGDTPLHDLPPVEGPVMVVLGAEGRGLGRLVRQRCDVVASIPLLGQTESLNVSVAGALAMYEVVRQRR